MKLYGLFKPTTLPNGRKRYVRVEGTDAYQRATAVRVFQDRLIWEGLCLRPVAEAPASTPPAHVEAGQCRRCFDHLHTTCLGGDCNCACRMWNK